jgi:hypothetical protein
MENEKMATKKRRKELAVVVGKGKLAALRNSRIGRKGRDRENKSQVGKTLGAAAADRELVSRESIHVRLMTMPFAARGRSLCERGENERTTA